MQTDTVAVELTVRGTPRLRKPFKRGTDTQRVEQNRTLSVMWLSGAHIADISQAIGISVAAVLQRRPKLGLPKRRRVLRRAHEAH